jgi:ATP-dependent Clp protease ATP-binding subunit ClpX
MKTGARGLRSIVENVMIDIMFDIPSLKGRKKVTVSRKVIDESVKPDIVVLKKTA